MYCQSDVVNSLSEIQKNNPNKAIFFADSLLLTNQSKKDVVFIKYYKAEAFRENNDYKEALNLYKSILPNLKRAPKFYIKTLLGLSDLNSRLKKYTSANEQAIEALELARKNEFNKLIADAYNALSYISYVNNNYLKSLNYLLNAVELYKKYNDSILISSSYNNIAIIYKNIGDFDKALYYNNRSIEISQLKNDFIGIGKTYCNIGRLNEFVGDFKNATLYYDLAIKNNENHDIINSIPFRNIGDVYIELKQYNKAEKYYLKAIMLEKESHQDNFSKNIYKSLLSTAILKNDFKKALIYQSKADSIFNLNVRRDNEEKMKMLEFQHKLIQNKEVLKQEKNNHKKNKIIFGVFTGSLFLLGLYLFQRNKNNKLKIIQEKMDLEQQVLRSQMNPHFIFNALSAIQNSLLDNEPIKSASYLSRFAKLIRQNFDFINKNNILLKDEIDALKNYMDTQKMRFRDKFDYEINVLTNVEINMVEIPPLLLQPFVENAIEHGFKNKKEKGYIIINISKKTNKICFEIKDNGKGFDCSSEKDTKVHAIDVFKKRLKLRGLQDEKSFIIESSKKGTTIKFDLKQ